MADLDVLIPHYNDPRGLRLSLTSVRAQDWEGTIRVVVSDDGSPSNALAEAEQVCAKSGLEVDFLRHSENLGRPYMRNVLLDSIESPWVSWLDAGDSWMPQKISKQMTIARAVSGERHPLHFWVTCSYLWVRQGEKARLRRQNLCRNGDLTKALLAGKVGAYLWTLLGPAESFRSVGWFDEQLTRLQDLDYMIRFALTGGSLFSTHEEEPLASYHKSYGGRGGADMWRCHNRILSRYRPLMRTFHPAWDRRYEFKALMHSAEFAQADGDEELRRSLEARARRLRPFRYYRIKKFNASNKL